MTPESGKRKVTITRTRRPDGSYHVTGERVLGEIECSRCGEKIIMTDDVEGWETFSGKVTAWGPGQAVCEACHLLYVDSFDGGRVYQLRPYIGDAEGSDEP